MKKLVTNIQKHVGNSPGTLTYAGSRQAESVVVSYWENTPEADSELKVLDDPTQIPQAGKGVKQWINVAGIHDIELLKSIGNQFNIHPLFLEDILNPAQRPKVETIGDSLLVSVKALSLDETGQVKARSVNFVICGDAIFSFS
jgi:magnesium transporter